jgi:BirA family transcriptional regulator, biotin operon repressor / biotin---[acetyl-CoA-carboxylase] ligase
LKLKTGHPVSHFDRIDSTNAEARRSADRGELGPRWFWADLQTGGRGRMGRSWVSEPGNLYATFLFSIAAGPEVAAQASFVAALAVHDMVMALRPELNPRIKWPNDVLIGGAKFCGVLPEAVGSNPTRIAIGCGVNVAHSPPGTPYPVTCLSSPPPCGEGSGTGVAPGASRRPSPQPLPTGGRGITVESVLQELDASLSNRLMIWDESRGFAAIRRDWSERALGLGASVTAIAGTKEIRGTFSGLAADGALILTEPDGRTTHIHSGEVKFAELEILRNRDR